MPANQTFSAHLEAAAREHLTGSITLGRPPGTVYFLVGNLMHATAETPDETVLAGMEAIREIARRCPKAVPATKTVGDPVPQGVNLTGTSMSEVLATIKDAQHKAAPTRALIEELPSRATSPSLPPLPLLPAGTALFKGLPLEQVNFNLLLGTLPNSMITIESPIAVGVALIKDRALDTAFYHDGKKITWDDEALVSIRSMRNAQATVHILPADVIETIPAVVATPVVYEALQLEWLVWPQFLAELTRRGGLGVVELQTTEGSGVLILREGNPPIIYTDAHPAPGDYSLLDPLIASGIGSLRVRHSHLPSPTVSVPKNQSEAQPAPESKPGVATAKPEVASEDPKAEGREEKGVEPIVQPTPDAAPASSPDPAPPSPPPSPAVSPEPTTAPAEEVITPAGRPFSIEDLGGEIEVEMSPSDTSPDWADGKSFLQPQEVAPEPTAPESLPPVRPQDAPPVSPPAAPAPTEPGFIFPYEELEAAAQTALGPRASRLKPLLDQARDKNWTGEELADAVRRATFPAISEERLDSLANTLDEILSAAG